MRNGEYAKRSTEDKLLVVHQGAIGDLILSIPAIEALRRHYAHRRLHFLGHPGPLALVVSPGEEAASIQMPGFSSLYAASPDPPEAVRRFVNQFEAAVIFGRKGDDALAEGLKVLGVRQVIMIDPFPEGEVHVIDHQLSVLSSLGIEVRNRVPHIAVSEADERRASDFLYGLGVRGSDPMIVLHPGSGSIRKGWPPAHFGALARLIREHFHVRIAIIRGPADHLRHEAFSSETGDVGAVLIDSPPLRVLAAILRRGECFVGNDSGVTHVAAAVGARTIALFGPTNPEVWGPRGEKVQILRGEADCAPCNPEEMRRCDRQACLENLGVKTVHRAVGTLFSRGTGGGER